MLLFKNIKWGLNIWNLLGNIEAHRIDIYTNLILCLAKTENDRYNYYKSLEYTKIGEKVKEFVIN